VDPAQVGRKVRVCGVVESVQHVGPQFNLHKLRETEALSQRKVDVPHPGRPHGRGIDVASPDRQPGGGRSWQSHESRRIDVLNVSKAAAILVQHISRVDQVRPPAGLSDTREDGYSRSGCEYAGELPASQNRPS